MTDIVERLREAIIADAYRDNIITSGIFAERMVMERKEAADEIERLRAALTQIARFDDERALATTTTLNSWDNFSVKIARAALAHEEELPG